MKTELIINTLITCWSVITACLLTEHPNFSLARVHPLFNRKPFTCRPCLTFHLIWIISGSISISLHSASLFAMGVVFAFVTYAILYILDKGKIEK